MTDQAKAAVVVKYVMVPEGWMRDPEQVRKLAEHLESVGWRADARGNVECWDQGAAMAAEVVRLLLAAAPSSPDSSRLGEGLTDAEDTALDFCERRFPASSSHEVDRKVAAVCAALRRLSASPGVAGDGAMMNMLVAALKGIEAHHVEQNRLKGRNEKRSTTLKIARQALSQYEAAALGTVQRG